MATPRTDPGPGSPLPRAWAPHAAAAALYLGLALHATYPLWLAPAARIQGLSDPLLNAYILHWAQYAFFHQIYDFFQATMFWPNADALAYGEHLIAPAILALPFRVFTRSAVALHNLSLLQAYFFCALAAHALAFHYFRRALPATVAGVIYGFASYRIVQSGHLQLAHGEFLPLMVLGFERSLAGGSRRWSALLGAAALGQWLPSWSWAVFTLGLLAPFFAARFWQSRSELTRARFIAVFVPLVIAAALCIPVALPYARLKAQNAFYRPDDAAEGLSAVPSDLFRVASRMPIAAKLANRPERSSETAISPGPVPGVLFLLALAVAFAGLRPMLAREEPAARAAPAFPAKLWFGATLLVVSFAFGPEVRFDPAAPTGIPGPYALAERLMPFAGVMRVPARWMLPALLGFALAGGYVASAAAANRRNSVLVFAAALAGAYVKPLAFEGVEANPPEVYAWLDAQPFPSPILELPAGEIDDNRALLHATWHRQPMVNGSNGFFPFKHRTLMRELEAFPELGAISRLRELRVRYVVIDMDALNEAPEEYAGIMNRMLEKHGVPLDAAQRFGSAHFVVDLAKIAP